MNSFYILLMAAIVTGCVIGYLSGFIRILLFIIKIAASFIAAYALNPFAADIFRNNIPLASEWTQAIAFAAVFVWTFILMQLLHRTIKQKTFFFNKKILNRTGGALTGVIISITIVLFSLQATGIIDVPGNINAEMQANGITAAVDNSVEVINDKIAPIFQPQPTEVMALKAADSTADEGIVLPYVTEDFEIRQDLETEMLQLINTERNKRGLQSLSADREMEKAARLHSSDMFKRGYFSHYTPEGIDPFQRLRRLNITYFYAGENLAKAPTLVKAHVALMRSPGHRANILGASYGRVGIGILDGGAHGLMITQEFRD